MRQQSLKLLSLLLVLFALSAATAYPVAQADVAGAKPTTPTRDEVATLTVDPALLVGLENRAPSAPLASFAPSLTEGTEPNGTPATANPIVGDAAAPEVIYTPPLSITTFFASNNGFAGNMFDVANISPNAIVINSFDINLSTGVTGANISVYYTPNTYVGKESDSSQWTLMGTDTVDSAGDDQPTPVEIGGLVIPPGESYGFYVTVSNYQLVASMRYTNGDNVISNGDLSLTLGVGKGNPDFIGNTITSRTWNGTIYYSPSASISLTKTVGTDPNACATGNDLTLPATGGVVTYCYTVENTGGITLTNHILVDDQLGTILNNFSYPLAPGAFAFITETVQITQTVVNSATWTADKGSVTASASDTATVTVPLANPSIELNKTVGTEPTTCATTDSITLPATGGEVTYCFTLFNTGDITLTHHTLTDSHLGSLANGQPLDLPPGAGAYTTATATITQTTVNTAVWEAYIDGSPVPISATDDDTAMVTVPTANPSITVDKTVGLDSAVCATTDSVNLPLGGGEVTYCFEVTNTGDITLTHHTVTDSHLGSIVNGLAYDLAPGASIFITATAEVTQTTVNTAVWEAFIDGSPVPISATDDDTAEVIVAGLVTGVELSADDAQSGAVGSVVTYTVSITNTGNASNSFLLEVLSGDWATSLMTTTVILETGDTTTFEVYVTVPVTAADGEMDTAVIQATAGVGRSAGGGSTDTVSLTTTAVVDAPANPVTYLPLITKP